MAAGTCCGPAVARIVLHCMAICGHVVGVQSKPTWYSGVNFRSRLEARWAVLFDRLGWTWVYEPFDLDGYIPDFSVSFGCDPAVDCLVEVKAALSARELKERTAKVKNVGHSVLCFGVSPSLRFSRRGVCAGVQWVHDRGWYEPTCWDYDELNGWMLYWGEAPTPLGIHTAWGSACNITQWRPVCCEH